MKAKFIVAVAAAALLAGCFKDVSYKTNYILKPLVQELSNDPNLPFEGLKAYAFDVDTAFYTVASYEDALNGVIALKDNHAEQISTPTATAEPYAFEGSVGWMQMPLSSPTQMIVAVDPTNRLYGYTQQDLGENLPNLYVTVIFKPWKEGNTYKDGNWRFFNDFYEPPVYLDCFIEPSIQAEEGGPTAEISSLRAYAFAADTTAWYLASYEDALAGKITSKSDESTTRTNPNFTAYPEEDSPLYRMQVSEQTLMVVVVDRTEQLYAYSKQVVDLRGESVTFPIIFRAWQNAWISVENGWRVVNPKYDPNPETPIQTARR